MGRSKFFFCLLVLFLSCSRGVYNSSNKLYKKQTFLYSSILRQYPLEDSFNSGHDFIGSPNFNLRKPNFVIIHHTAQNSCEQTLATFTNTKSEVSAHYLICKDGAVYHLLNDYFRAWHAGVSKWGNDADINSSSIGIELDNNGFEKFTEAQMQSLIKLLNSLKSAYNIPTANFIGHGDVAPGRKVDPSYFFNWKRLSDNGFGNWFGDTTNLVLPEGFSPLNALRIIGYNTSDTTAAIKAFRRHWLNDTACCLSAGDKKIIYSLLQKAQ